MTVLTAKVLSDALALPPVERASLVDALVASFDFPARAENDAAWAAEVEDRIDAYEKGELTSIPVEAVFERINGMQRR